jgi:transposase
MLTLPPSVRVFIAIGATDMRKQFDGLIALARDVVRQDPLSGHIFGFCNKRRDRIKLLFFDRSGFWLCAKRLEKGTFSWPTPAAASTSVELSSPELALLLSGIDLARTKRRQWWDRVVAQ